MAVRGGGEGQGVRREDGGRCILQRNRTGIRRRRVVRNHHQERIPIRRGLWGQMLLRPVAAGVKLFLRLRVWLFLSTEKVPI